MAENKVFFNLKNVHLAVKQDGNAWGNVMALPGAVSINLDPAGELSKFYADGIVYFTQSANNGYTGTLEIARLLDEVRKAIWGAGEDENHVLCETINDTQAHFALMFQIDGDVDNEYYLFYDVSAERPSIASQTTEETIEPRTQSLEMNCIPLADGRVFCRTTSLTPSEVKENWFESVYNQNGGAGSDAKQILTFTVAGVNATINGNTITAVVPAATDLTSIAPTFTISTDATAFPASGDSVDLSNEATYTVTAENGTKRYYSVNVVKEA